MLDWNHLQFLLAIARSRSLSGAARTLSVEHSTVGRRLATIERALHARLFDRTPDGYMATAAGEIVISHAQAIEEHALSLEREVLGRDARVSGTVRLTALDACIDDFILPNLAGLRQQHPDLMIVAASEMQMVNLARREADIAIRYVPPKAPNLVVRKLAEVGSALYASRDYVRRRGKLKAATALDGHELIGLVPEFSMATEEQWLVEHGRRGRVVLRVASQQTMKAAIRAGVGIGIIECQSADRDPNLLRIWEEPLFTDTWWTVVHGDLARAARIRAVMKFLVDLSAIHRDRLLGLRSPPGKGARRNESRR